MQLARADYDRERAAVPALPPVDALPNLEQFADNGLGMAAFDGDELLGFLCFYTPWDNAFTTNARGTFSPIHAHSTVAHDRERIYKRLYQAAADKLVRMGVGCHAVGLYAHDAAAIHAFYTYGFGLRCVDAIRPMERLRSTAAAVDGFDFCELSSERKLDILPLGNLLVEHLGNSPMFMHHPLWDADALGERLRRESARYFAAYRDGGMVAYIKIADHGENFACDDAGMQNICGGSCVPEHRGTGLYAHLLDYTIGVLAAEGYTRLGVDFESFNPTAYGFWLKHFTAYTHSVVRRIDEKALGGTL